MASEWLETTVGQFSPFKYGKGLPERDRKPGGVNVYSSAGIVGKHDVAYVAKAGVIVGRKGTVGSVYYSPSPFWPIDTAFYIDDLPEIRDIRYTYYLLKTLGLEHMNTDSAVPGLNRENAHALRIKVPDMEGQKQIADFLELLDNRITLLRETNKTLEDIARAIFKSWFIDYDPVRAKMQGRAPAGMDEKTAELFPNDIVGSEFGLVPDGWRLGSLADLSHLNPESWSARRKPDRLAYIDLANAKDNVISELVEYDFDEAPSRARRVLRSGDTIIGTVRPGNRSFAFISDPAKNLTGSTGFAVLRPVKSENTEFVYLAATRNESIERLAHLADGGAYPAVRPEEVAQLPCVIPSESVMKAFHELVNVLLTKSSNNQLAVQTLSEIRDTLLPRLISGKLRVTYDELEAQT